MGDKADLKEISFLEEDSESAAVWHVLVVDDERDVHSVTRLVLNGVEILGRPLELFHAYSGAEAIALLDGNPTIAVVLLDIVMETDDAGLRVARHVREELGNTLIRIIFRTGQPGQVDENTAALDYGGDYYEAKSQLTSKRLLGTLQMSIKAYDNCAKLVRANERLEQAMADRDLFTNAIAHDIKGPVREISCFCDLLEAELTPTADNSALEYVGFINDAAKRLTTIQEELTRLSRLGGDSLVRETLPVATLVDKALASAAHLIRNAGATCEKHVDGTLYGDAEKLLLALNNLLGNALKFTHPERHTHITISSRRVGDATILSIADNGIGIPQSVMPLIFLPFRRGVTAEQYPGAGIGLAVCQKIINLHGGDIWVESILDEGTTFHIQLPCAPVP